MGICAVVRDLDSASGEEAPGPAFFFGHGCSNQYKADENKLRRQMRIRAIGRIKVHAQAVSVTLQSHLVERHHNRFLLYWLPKEIAEMPRVEAPGPRRDEGVDEHPRPRNNAGTGVSTPESEFSCPRSGTSSLPPNYLISARTFGNQYIYQHIRMAVSKGAWGEYEAHPVLSP